MSSSGAQGFFARSLVIAEFSGDSGPRGGRWWCVGVSEGIVGFRGEFILRSEDLLLIGITLI